MRVSERKKAAADFYNRWHDRGNERQDSQSFWLDLLQNVYGIENPAEYITFEDSVLNMMDNTSFMDGYIEKTNVLIEQKGKHRDLNKGIKQSDGSYLTPFQQALRYSATLPYSRRPRWIITSNFKQFNIYDMEKPNAEPSVLKLEDLKKEYYRLEILVDKTNTQIEKETEISIQAGELIGQIYDELVKQYKNPEDPNSLQSINQLCVRFVFCFYAEDAGLFGKRGMFHDYLKDFDTRSFRNAIIDLFKVLNIKIEDRDPYLDDKLAQFPYVNGGLFEDMDIEIPQFTEVLKDLVLGNTSSEFDWSEISPTIFGGVFESTLNPEARHEGGMHYTSIENIHKIIDPLFLNELKNELNEIKQFKQHSAINRKALEFQNKLAELKFIDPACGSGNFLTETYISLRELENEALALMLGNNIRLDTNENLIKVTLDQFYGIEINDFAVSVAKTALWIAESQVFEETKNLIYSDIDYLPIKSYANIIEGNALRMDWEKVVDSSEVNYIIGNPPFLGHQWTNDEQTKDMAIAFHDLKLHGKFDYVSAWYNKAIDYIVNTDIEVAYVSTNSISQGESISLWKFLFEKGLEIQFAHRTFVWKSEAADKASVHCVIIGFTSYHKDSDKLLFENDMVKKVKHINGYLVEGEDVFLQSRGKPLSPELKEMKKGSQATDGKNLQLSVEEYEEFISKYPESKHLVKEYIGSHEFINKKTRYCFWLTKDNYTQFASNPYIMNRLKLVAEFRKTSKTESVREAAQTPYLFTQIRQPKDDYLVFPALSSGNRRYLPIGYLDKEVIASSQLYVIPDASLYLFGLYTSNVHNAWMRAVCGRHKSDYRYAPFIYNNFPLPKVNQKQKEQITSTAEQILKARELYPDATLAQLYNELTMPMELLRAHQDNDRAVMDAYGMKVGSTSESESLAILFKMYSDLVK